MSLGFDTLVVVMPVTAQQRQRLEAGNAIGPREEIWAECVKVIEQKKTDSVKEYRHFPSALGDRTPHRKGVIPGCIAALEFLGLYGAGMMLQQEYKMKHESVLSQRGCYIAPGVMRCSINDDVAMENCGWLLRHQVGRIDCDTGIYDGEQLKAEISKERDAEILKRFGDYALCLLELYGEKDIKHVG